jgi:V/A-type H+-transporting ATPase subunit C
VKDVPQISHAYAVGRVRVLEQMLLNEQALERLIACENLDEVLRALAEAGWGDAASKNEVDRLADRHIADACKLVREITPEPVITDCFLIKYDVLNMKVLVKSRALGISDAALSENGTIPADRLRRIVGERRYQDLPAPFADALMRIDKKFLSEEDPLYVDAELDKAMGEYIRAALKGTKNDTVRRYFADRTDVVNLLIALRCHRIGRGSALAKELFIPGGEIDVAELSRIADEPEGLYTCIERRGFARPMKEALAQRDGEALAFVERQLDDYLLSLIRRHKNEPLTVMPVIGYLLAKERECAAVRLIVIAKDARVPNDKLRLRLRELYA